MADTVPVRHAQRREALVSLRTALLQSLVCTFVAPELILRPGEAEQAGGGLAVGDTLAARALLGSGALLIVLAAGVGQRGTLVNLHVRGGGLWSLRRTCGGTC